MGHVVLVKKWGGGCIPEHDPAKGYASDVFVGVREDLLERTIAIDYLRHGLELAQRSENDLATRFSTELSRAVQHAERRSVAAREIISMHKRHGEVVSRVLEQQLRTHAAALVEGTLDPTSLLAMVTTRQHLPASNQSQPGTTQDGRVGGKAGPSLSGQSPDAAILRVEASLQNLHAKIDAGPVPKAPKKTNARPGRRDSIVFAAILLELKGTRYCSFLKAHEVMPRWETPCPSNYDTGYKAGQPWQKKIQDEKCRAKVRMEGYTDAALADAFNFYLPDKFKELSDLLNSRNSRPASKTSATPKPRKH